VVTLLTLPPPVFPLELELESDDEPVLCELVEDDVPESDPEVVPELVVVAGVDATVVAEDCFASAGSCPDTSTIVISSHEATNSATAPLMMRRRIMLVRLRRAARIAWPRARASCRSLSFMVRYLVVGPRRDEACSLASIPPISAA
jgi:hypothetical protein